MLILRKKFTSKSTFQLATLNSNLKRLKKETQSQIQLESNSNSPIRFEPLYCCILLLHQHRIAPTPRVFHSTLLMESNRLLDLLRNALLLLMRFSLTVEFVCASTLFRTTLLPVFPAFHLLSPFLRFLVLKISIRKPKEEMTIFSCHFIFF